jgi:hypothetical protein
MPIETALLASAGRMPKRSQHRANGGQDARSERPGDGVRQPLARTQEAAGASGEMAWATRAAHRKTCAVGRSPARHCRSVPVSRTAMKAFCGMSTLPTLFIRFLPSFCFAQSFFLREMSPP